MEVVSLKIETTKAKIWEEHSILTDHESDQELFVDYYLNLYKKQIISWEEMEDHLKKLKLQNFPQYKNNL